MSETRMTLIRRFIDTYDVDALRDVIYEVVDMFDKAAALVYAVKLASRPCVAVLLDAGCDPCLKYEGRTALYWAVVTDDTETLDLLLSDLAWLIHTDKHSLIQLDKPTNSTNHELYKTETLALELGNPQSPKNGCFGFLYMGNNKRTELQKQQAKVVRAVNTALFEAASHPSIHCAEKLLGLGANVNAFHYHDDEILSWCSALISACAAPVTNAARVNTELALKMVEILVRYGADISSQNCYGQTALHWASRSGLTSVLPLLLRNGADVDAKDKMGQTPLMGACDHGGWDCVEVCRTLMEWGADVSCRGDKDDYTAFHFAVGNNNEELVHMFLDAGTCPTSGTRFKPISEKHCAYVGVTQNDSSTWQQLTPLDIAVNNNQIAMVKCLLKAYADINAPSHYNQTVTTGGGLIYLATDSAEISELLVNAGFDRHSCLLVAKNRQVKANIKEVLKLAEVPPSLMHICRLLIRQKISPNYVRCHELPLPRQLLRYINMEDLLC